MSKRTRILVICGLLLTLSIILTAMVQAQIDTIKLVCVGNSITEGYGTANIAFDNYPAQTAILLSDEWSVKNAGVSGRTMLRNGDFPIWNEQKFKDGLAFNPDVVTIALGTNDSKPYNWIYKDNFVADYSAMIDTFRSLPSHPTVWLCLPPPSFSDAFDISDSVINADIIPMIRGLAETKGCQIVDFNTLLLGHSDLVPDGIHPNTFGSALMAEYLFSRLTGKTFTQVTEENVAEGKNVTVNGSIDSLVYGSANLVDGRNATQWITLGFPAEAVVDLGSDQYIDLFRIDFESTGAANAGYQLRIETAGSAGGWTTALDRTARTDSAATILEKTDSISARFVRLSITGAARPRGDTVSVAEFRIMKANGSAHTPVITAKKMGGTASNPRYDIKLQWPNGSQGSVMVYRLSSAYGLSAATGFRAGTSFTINNEYIKAVNYNVYHTVTFYNGVETTSDTTVVGTLPNGIEEFETSGIPLDIQLLPCYPNPFNPSTTISFSIPDKSYVSLKIFDVTGRDVATLVSGQLPAGLHSRQWDAVDMPSGVYFTRLQVGNTVETKKLVVVK
jgi:acyl-CoA thioesterase I